MGQAAPNNPVLAAALDFAAAGCSVVPVRADGTKVPAGAWKTYQTERADTAQIQQWFTDGHPGVGIVCGTVSGNLEMLELEGRAIAGNMLLELNERAMENGLADLWRRITGGYCEQTPSGGVHFLYRVDGTVPGNTKLARRPATTDELAANPADKIKVLVETRGEGGFVVVAPSHGTVHHTGKPWVRIIGDPASIPTISADDHRALHALTRLADRMPLPEPSAPVIDPLDALDPPSRSGGGTSPGDDYNTRASWDDLLGRHGWTPVWRRGKETGWRRPGKTDLGISATTGYGDRGDWLYVFTTSTDFDAEKTYTKFAAYAVLEHAGDYRAAASALRVAGYGTPPPEQPRPAAVITTSDDDQPDPPGTASTYSRTDDGNALRLVDSHADAIRYCPQRGQWLAWDGHRWRWDDAETVREHTRAIARSLPAGDKGEIAHRQWSLSARGVTAAVRLAQSDPRIVTNLGALDAKPYQLNTPAGVIDLRTGDLQPPRPDALHTRSTVVAPDPTEAPSRWLAFLADTFAGDPDVTTYVQRLLGLSLVGTVLEQILPFAYGEGANGKTTLLGTIQRLIGVGDDGYSISAPAELLLATTNNGHPTEIARLAGARLVVTSELDEGQRFAEAKVKLLTGRDTITGRFMRQDFFSFTPTHTLWLLGNHQPSVRAGGPAFWRRLRLVPFLHTVPADRRDPHLEDTLVDREGPAILAWLIQGAADYFTHGLTEPTAVATATDAYQRDQDTIARFVDDTCTLHPTRAVRVAALRTAYEKWCNVEGEQAVSTKAFTLALRSRYDVTSERDRNTRYYRGIALVDNDETTASDLSPDLSQPADEPPDDWWQR